jgi:hypothetical protein
MVISFLVSELFPQPVVFRFQRIHVLPVSYNFCIEVGYLLLPDEQ